MLLFVIADASDDGNFNVNVYFVAAVVVIIAALIYIFRHFIRR